MPMSANYAEAERQRCAERKTTPVAVREMLRQRIVVAGSIGAAADALGVGKSTLGNQLGGLAPLGPTLLDALFGSAPDAPLQPAPPSPPSPPPADDAADTWQDQALAALGAARDAAREAQREHDREARRAAERLARIEAAIAAITEIEREAERLEA